MSVVVNLGPVDVSSALEYGFSFTHGAGRYGGGISPSTFSGTFRTTDSDLITTFLNESIEVVVDTYPRFFGRISEMVKSYNHKNGEYSYQITATGESQNLELQFETITGWPTEFVTDRLLRIGIVGESFQTVGPLAAGTYSHADIVNDVLAAYGGNVYDRGDGYIVVNCLDTRNTANINADPGEVFYNPQVSYSTAEIANEIFLSTPVGDYYASDENSQGWFGLRSIESFANIPYLGVAENRIGHAIAARAGVQTVLPQMTMFREALATSDYANLWPGTVVWVDGFPDFFPLVKYPLIVEGLTETFTKASRVSPAKHVISLAISDPRLSPINLAWQDFPTGFTWADFPAGVKWRDLLTLESIGI